MIQLNVFKKNGSRATRYINPERIVKIIDQDYYTIIYLNHYANSLKEYEVIYTDLSSKKIKEEIDKTNTYTYYKVELYEYRKNIHINIYKISKYILGQIPDTYLGVLNNNKCILLNKKSVDIINKFILARGETSVVKEYSIIDNLKQKDKPFLLLPSYTVNSNTLE